MVDIPKYRVEVAVGNTWGAQYFPLYEIKCIRAQLGLRFRNLDAGAIKVSKDVSHAAAPVIEGATLGGERARLLNTYKKEVFYRAFPTEEDFEEEFRASLPAEALGEVSPDPAAVTLRKTMPIEAIKGISPSVADGIAAVLGDGEIATLAEADPIELQGLAGVSLTGAKRFIDEASKLVKSSVFKE